MEDERDLNGRREGFSREMGERGSARGMEEKGDRDRGESPCAPSTQGDSSLRELGWVRPPPLAISLFAPSRPGGLVGSYGVAIVGAGVANRFSAISPRLPPK